MEGTAPARSNHHSTLHRPHEYAISMKQNLKGSHHYFAQARFPNQRQTEKDYSTLPLTRATRASLLGDYSLLEDIL